MSPQAELGAWSTAIAGAIAAFALIRRKWSSDAAAISKDRLESRFLDNAIDERNEALRAVRELLGARQVDAETMATLRGQLRNVETERMRDRMEFDAFKRRVLRAFPEARAFAESAFQPLPP